MKEYGGQPIFDGARGVSSLTHGTKVGQCGERIRAGFPAEIEGGVRGSRRTGGRDGQREICVEPQTELLPAVLDEQERGPILPFTTPETVADGIHQAGDLALPAIGKVAFRSFVKQYPLLAVWDAADDVNQVWGGRLGVGFHVFI